MRPGLGETVKAIAEKTTVVLVGSFNPSILSPQWVAVHGLGYPPEKEFQVEMLAAIGGANQQRFSFEGLSYSAAYRRLTFHLDPHDVAGSERQIEVAAKILHELPHTPLNGVGLNFAFHVEQPSQALLALFTPCPALSAAFDDAAVAARRWGNVMKWNDCLAQVDCEVSDQGGALLTLNFHYGTKSAAAAQEILSNEGAFAQHRSRAVAAASALTGEQLEEEPNVN